MKTEAAHLCFPHFTKHYSAESWIKHTHPYMNSGSYREHQTSFLLLLSSPILRRSLQWTWALPLVTENIYLTGANLAWLPLNMKSISTEIHGGEQLPAFLHASLENHLGWKRPLRSSNPTLMLHAIILHKISHYFMFIYHLAFDCAQHVLDVSSSNFQCQVILD